ncbi:hypothetical protein [Pseudofrankia inefficax]|uniref:Uncharacterized protein n=1 Tax=Pseudofrankia inefficax (strain DSM 45817 / CECT 9037 / DDB 130130 / EuI1c) TaxID=298654 RepID=E3J705_PSEI1|nr:hypothetical protein [Pseudofrankia inefficax]ADP83225.1 hypothetical protein FraEuI1c_5237 [Pseudofrankia inefficax]
MKTRIVAAVALAMTLAACGGSGSGGGQATAATRSESATAAPETATDTLGAKVDDASAAVCVALRDGNAGSVISNIGNYLQTTQTAATALVTAIAAARCSDLLVPADPTTGPTTVPPAAETTIGPGTWLVGKDIQPGTFETTTTGTGIGSSCYWARLSGTSGDFKEILANGNVEGHGIVTIKPTDVAFQTPCTWTKIS